MSLHHSIHYEILKIRFHILRLSIITNRQSFQLSLTIIICEQISSRNFVYVHFQVSLLLLESNLSINFQELQSRTSYRETFTPIQFLNCFASSIASFKFLEFASRQYPLSHERVKVFIPQSISFQLQ